MIFKKIKQYFKNPLKIVLFLMDKNTLWFLPDRQYLKIKFWLKFNTKLNLDTPLTFNEKLQWLKLNDRRKIYTSMVDKNTVKEYVGNIIGKEHIIPTLGIWSSPNDIDFNLLPKKFVLKLTHDSGTVIICKDKDKLDIEAVKNRLKKGLKRDYYALHREWPYKNVERKIIAEKFMDDNKSGELTDYKFFCFNGEPKIVLVCSERFSSENMSETWYDEEWNLLPVSEGGYKTNTNIPKPMNFMKMKQFSSQLSKKMPFVRIDFYEINGNIYFGEITFFPAAGYERFDPEEWNKKLGDMIDLGLAEYKNEK